MQTEMTLRELTVKYSVKKDVDGQPVSIGRVLRSARDATAALAATLEHEPSEVFAILCLTTKNRVIAYHEVSRGALDCTIVHPREVFKAALLANASGIILAHNHPSGDPTPSPDDLALTQRLQESGAILGIHVLDHIVIGDGRSVSFRETGRL